jgi:hypothetical protein
LLLVACNPVPVFQSPSKFDFNKDQLLALAGDNVNFTNDTASSPRENDISRDQQHKRGQTFSAASGYFGSFTI